MRVKIQHFPDPLPNSSERSVIAGGIAGIHGWDALRAIDLYKRVLSDIWVDYSNEWDASLCACLIARSADLREPIDLLEDLRAVVYGKEAYVIGAGPSLLSRKPRFREGDVVFCADGACSILEDSSVTAISVTDLDGGVEPADRVYSMGGYIVLQIHSDNYRSIATNTDLVRRWRERILITVQTHPPCSSVTVVPGFTDGDRAYLLALLLGASRIKTIGMDLLSEISTGFSKKMYGESGYSTPGKLRKLRWAYRIIDSIGQNLY